MADRSDHPPFRYADYRSSRLRSPDRAPIAIARTLAEATGPGPIWSELSVEDADLTTNADTGTRAIGARMMVMGCVLDEYGEPQANQLIEIWQANSAGRYLHRADNAYDAPLDPNFIGIGQCKTNADGVYTFTTIRPGPYPWMNHPNAWRPAHIHLSIFGRSQGTRLVTQMYFPGDPLLELDPIFQSVPEHARGRLIARYEHTLTREMSALGYRFDIVLPALGGFTP